MAVKAIVITDGHPVTGDYKELSTALTELNVVFVESLPPTEDPEVEGEVWIDEGVWKVSAGAV